MKSVTLLLVVFIVSWTNPSHEWSVQEHKQFRLYYTPADKGNTKAYAGLLKQGIKDLQQFFDTGFRKPFDVYIYPDRAALDSSWRKNWDMPDFRSECWMVASGVALRMDMISPKKWDEQACEHHYADKLKTQRLITHELVHIFHGQRNNSPDFSDTEGLDWFIEGLATFASGQCDTQRIAAVKTALIEKKVPKSITEFWNGKLKYGLSGSVVMYINHRFGRNKLMELLAYNKLTDVLAKLEMTEEELLKGWRDYVIAM